jgi:hypothetical protein
MEPDLRNIGYCKGFVDGYEKGIENNTWSEEMDVYNYLQYKWGYDAGVAEYSRDEIDEPIEA